ncbi:MAG: hypothetical protein LBH06_00900 [Rikenellaceae bacterium]|jgi:hypothetical protein|nr:hypothetical protein [Rikenellaceae bacterium]
MSGMVGKKRLGVDWSEYRRELLADSGKFEAGNEVARQKFRKKLEADPLAWIEFFFEREAKYPFAPFQRDFFKRINKHDEWYEVVSWSRELAKSTCTMFIVLYLVLAGRKRNVLLVSASYEAAKRLLEPYRANLDSNPRIKAYYGEQFSPGHWEEGDFQTASGASFRALGAGQSPRGTKSIEGARPDVLLVDDFDTDEDVLNPVTVSKKYDWYEQALRGTRSISEPLLTIVCGNIIADDCCVTRAGAIADHWDVVNIRDRDGHSSWPKKNSEEQIDRVLSTMSTRSAQREYFNNPLAEGTVFGPLTYGRCPPLGGLQFVVSYCDPSPSNSDRQKRGTSFKANILMGYRDGKFYIYKCFLDQTTTAEMVEWPYLMRDYVAGRTQVFFAVENNTLQDPFYQQVYMPLFHRLGETKGYIPVTPDTRKKPDKASRIEGNLEPVNRQGLLVLNEAERDNPHMRRLAEQFRLFTPQLKAPADGPDCVEGAWYWLNERIRQSAFAPVAGRRKEPKNMY